MSPESGQQVLSKQEVVSRLQARGITPTRQRVIIGRYLFARPQHLSAEQVLEIVTQADGAVSKATVYNTLNLFARRGLVREVIVDPTKLFYDSNTSEHPHLYDVEAGSLTDLMPHECRLTGMPALPEGTTVVGVDVVLRVRHR